MDLPLPAASAGASTGRNDVYSIEHYYLLHMHAVFAFLLSAVFLGPKEIWNNKKELATHWGRKTKNK
jgi:uncharacterized Tic20 family protein